MSSGKAIDATKASGKSEKFRGGKFAHVFAFWAFAVVQPFLDLLGRYPEFFAARRVGALELVVLTLIFVAALPFAAWAMLVIIGRKKEKTARFIFGIVMWILCVAFFLNVLKDLSWENWKMVVLLAELLSVAVVFMYFKVRAIREFFTVLLVAPVLFTFLFLCVSPAKSLIFRGDQPVSTHKVNSSRPVVLVVFDEFPVLSLLNKDGKIDAKRYPAFGQLAKESTWFSNATTSYEWTTIAVPAIMTGKIPGNGRKKLPIYSEYPDSIFTWLGGSYKVNVFESITEVCPPYVCTGEKQRFGQRVKPMLEDLVTVYAHLVVPEVKRDKLPSITTDWKDFGGLDLLFGVDDQKGNTSAADRQMKKILVKNGEINHDRRAITENFADKFDDSSRKKSLNFLHVELPHSPYEYLNDGTKVLQVGVSSGIGLSSDGKWGNEQVPIDVSRQRHMLQVQFTDKMLGVIIDELKKEGIWEDAIVVITADHGVGFQQGEHYRVAGREPAEIAYVPMFVRNGDKDNGVEIDRHVITSDVLPTIADLLDEDLPFEVDGFSMFDQSVKDSAARNTMVREADLPDVKYPEDMLLDRDRLIGKIQGLFYGAEDFYHFGKYGRMVGRRADELASRDQGDLKVESQQIPFFANIDLEDEIPSSVNATVTGDGLAVGDYIAFVLNGRIAAVGEVYSEAKVLKFAGSLSPEFFVNGKNELSFHRVFEDGGSIVLGGGGSGKDAPSGQPVSSSGTQNAYALQNKKLGQVLVSDKGIEVPIASGAVDGNVENLVIDGKDGYLRIGGWAGIKSSGAAADRVVITSDGKMIGGGTTVVPRVDLGSIFKSKTVTPGFDFVLDDAGIVQSGDDREIRFFAIGGGWASELTMNCKDDGLGALCRKISGPPEADEGGAAWQLTEAGLQGPTGENIAVDLEGFSGDAKLVGKDDTYSVFGGWAGNTVDGVPAETIVLFQGKKYVGTAVVNQKQQGVADTFKKPGLLTSGWGLTVPNSWIQEGDLEMFVSYKGKFSKVK